MLTYLIVEKKTFLIMVFGKYIAWSETVGKKKASLFISSIGTIIGKRPWIRSYLLLRNRGY